MGPGFESLKVHQRIRDTEESVQGIDKRIDKSSRAEMRMNREVESWKTEGKNQRLKTKKLQREVC